MQGQWCCIIPSNVHCNMRITHLSFMSCRERSVHVINLFSWAYHIHLQYFCKVCIMDKISPNLLHFYFTKRTFGWLNKSWVDWSKKCKEWTTVKQWICLKKFLHQYLMNQQYMQQWKRVWATGSLQNDRWQQQQQQQQWYI